jgi:hypothetical protein
MALAEGLVAGFSKSPLKSAEENSRGIDTLLVLVTVSSDGYCVSRCVALSDAQN